MEKEEEALELVIVHNADIFWNGISPSPPFRQTEFQVFRKGQGDKKLHKSVWTSSQLEIFLNLKTKYLQKNLNDADAAFNVLKALRKMTEKYDCIIHDMLRFKILECAFS